MSLPRCPRCGAPLPRHYPPCPETRRQESARQAELGATFAGAALWRGTLARRVLGSAWAPLRAWQLRAIERFRVEDLVVRAVRRAGGWT